MVMNSLPQASPPIHRPVRAAAAAAASLICLYAGTQDGNRDLDIIASQIRRQGFVCNNPSAAELIDRGTPHQKVYLLKCEGVIYRVRLTPDLAGKVTEIK